MLLLLVAAACGDAPTGNADPEPQPGPAPVASIELSPGDAELTIGNWKQLAATPRARDGRALTGRVVAWTSSDAGIATVSENGVVATHDAGIVFITATSEGQAAVARVVVNAPGRIVAAVRLGPPAVSLEVGASRFLTATAVDSNHYLVAGRPVAFASSDASIVSVDANGRVTALRAGVAFVTATIDGKSAQSRVEVVASAPRVAGTWSVVIEELVGEGTSCAIDGLALELTQDGERLGGEIRGLEGGPRVDCAITGGNPPFVTPLPPLGRVVGRVTAEQGGAVVTIQTEQGGWSFSGFIDDGQFVGRAALDVQRDGQLETRRVVLAAPPSPPPGIRRVPVRRARLLQRGADVRAPAGSGAGSAVTLGGRPTNVERRTQESVMHRLVVRSLVLAAGLVTAAPGARAQGADACTDLPVTTLLAMADPEASRDAPISLLAAGTAPACRPLGIGQPPLLGSIVPPAIEVAPLEGDDLVASVAVIANPVVGVAVAAGGAAAWVAAGSGVVNSASGSTSGVVAPDAVAPNVILNPEPATLVLCASGLAALGVALRHRFRA